MAGLDNHRQFITRYKSQEDRSKPRRVLDTIKIGEMYIGRLALEPDVVAANMYHEKTNLILFVTAGSVRFKFVQIDSGQSEEFEADPSFGVIHQPSRSAVALRNTHLGESVVFIFSNRPLRRDDDYPYPIYEPDTGASVPLPPAGPANGDQRKPMTHYPFQQDRRKPGRLLETVKVGGVWISRVTIDPGVITGNLYHQKTSVMMFVTQGRLRFKFVQINTGEQKEFEMERGRGLIHLPPYVAIADKNIGKDPAVVYYLSNHPFRLDDDYEYKIY